MQRPASCSENSASAQGSRKRSSRRGPAWPARRSPASKRGTTSHTPEWSGYLAKALGIPRASLLGYEFDEGVKVEDIEFFEPDKVDRMDFYGDDEEEEE